MKFNGPDLTEQDEIRLTGQIQRVFDCMKDGQWRTLNNIAAVTGDPHASVSAQLRHLRKKEFGSHTVDRRHVGNGLYEYQLIVAGPKPPGRLF